MNQKKFGYKTLNQVYLQKLINQEKVAFITSIFHQLFADFYQRLKSY